MDQPLPPQRCQGIAGARSWAGTTTARAEGLSHNRERPSPSARWHGRGFPAGPLASDLRSRLRAHLRDRHARVWDSFSLFLTLGGDSLRELEALLIRIAKPRGNRSKTRFPRSQDLRKVFRQQVRVKQQENLESPFVGSGRRGRPRTRRRENSTTPLGPYVRGSLAIRMTRKGHTYKALVRSDGSIRFRGKVFRSPSTAASEVTGRPMNGWWWWKYERAPGEWVRIDELRK